MFFMGDNPWGGSVLLHGQSYPAAHLPWTYLPTWLLISLPEFYFLGLGLGVGAAIRAWVRNRPSLAEFWPYVLLIVAVLFPAAVIMGMHSPIYDGMRHIMFMVPPLAILAAAGLVHFWETFPGRRTRGPVAVALGLTLALTFYDLVTLHPYQTIYFNRLFAGGVKQALRQYDGDYWGQTYHAGADWIVQHYPQESLNVGVPYMAKRLNYYFNRQAEIRRRRQMLLAYLQGKRPSLEPLVPRLRPVGPEWDGVSQEDGTLYGEHAYKLFLSGTQMRANDSVPGKVLTCLSHRRGDINRCVCFYIKEWAISSSDQKTRSHGEREEFGLNITLADRLV
jgi:hypothetical protein